MFYQQLQSVAQANLIAADSMMISYGTSRGKLGYKLERLLQALKKKKESHTFHLSHS